MGAGQFGVTSVMAKLQNKELKMSGESGIKKSGCFFCHDGCGVLMDVKDGRIVKVKPDPDFSFSACERTKMAEEYHLHPDRLNYPLRRDGARGEGKWKRITWEQALDEIAQKLSEIRERYGPESLFMPEGDAQCDRWAGMRFLNLFGSPNHDSPGDIDHFNKLMSHYVIYGAPSYADFTPGVTKCMVNWGGEPRSFSFWSMAVNGCGQKIRS
ncbi:molybdopterin-dependent oxidoreductase [Chloroflexota bacterium]